MTDAPDPGPRVVPARLRLWLARLRLLEAVPFSYLVADAELLPTESIRFFYLDRALDRRAGAGRAERRHGQRRPTAPQLEALYPVIRDEVDEAERLVRLPGGSRSARAERQGRPDHRLPAALARGVGLAGPARARLRQATTSRPTTIADRTSTSRRPTRAAAVLRMERLAPAVLLVPVRRASPRSSTSRSPRRASSSASIRRPLPAASRPGCRCATCDTGDPAAAQATPTTRCARSRCPSGETRRASIHIATLRRADRRGAEHASARVEPHELGIQMLRFPFRAVFGDQTLSDEDAAVIDLDAMFGPASGSPSSSSASKGTRHERPTTPSASAEAGADPGVQRPDRVDARRRT